MFGIIYIVTVSNSKTHIKYTYSLLRSSTTFRMTGYLGSQG